MKKQIAILATILAAGSLSAFGQGYMIFGGSKGFVYDDASGTSTPSSSEDSVTFLWSATGTSDLLGAGIPTTGGTATGGWADIATMLSSDGWNVATVSGGSEADVAVNSSTLAKGGISFNGSTAFALADSVGGATIDVIVVGWNNDGGTLNTLEAAEGADSALGWDSEFTYATGVSSGSQFDATMNASGGSAFAVAAVAPVPEPTTLVLAGLGGLSMLGLRRRKA